jgi:hypothetical protein
MCQYLKYSNDEEVIQIVSAGFNDLLFDLSMTNHVQMFISTMDTITKIVEIKLSVSNIGDEFTEMLRNEYLFCFEILFQYKQIKVLPAYYKIF